MPRSSFPGLPKLEILKSRSSRGWGGGRTAVAVLSGGALIVVGCGSSTVRPTTSAPTSTSGSTASVQQTSTHNKLRSLPQVQAATGRTPAPSPTATTADRSFLEAVFNDAQDFWRREFAAAGLTYSPARLVIFSSNVRSGCGVHEDAGPFYCGADHGIYLDLTWFDVLARLARVGSFAQAYIVGHEFGHHVQHLLGIDVGAAARVNPSRKNALSVAGELQADCLAGVWAHSVYSRGELTASDINDMLNKAEVIGDDFAARSSGQPVDPGLFTHGSSAQRQHWLRTGFESGDPEDCDTFSSGQLTGPGAAR
ncbi:MAG: neutral zinc metallopeptidase [Solirubrobacterales bacterium]|nr:neutral zinc metallopeptidase [Solirubrobacterales bacterium]